MSLSSSSYYALTSQQFKGCSNLTRKHLYPVIVARIRFQDGYMLASITSWWEYQNLMMAARQQS